MAIDSRVPLMVQPPQWGQNFQQDLLQAQRNKEEAPYRQRLLEAQTSGAEQQVDAGKQQQLQNEDRSVILGSAAIKTFLDTGNTEGARQYLTQRKTQLQRLGLNTSHTDEALGLIDQNPQQLKAMVDQNVEIGGRLGVFGKPIAPTNEQQNLESLGYRPGTPAYAKAFQDLYGKTDPNKITAYQQAQIRIDEAKLQFERDKLEKGEAAKPPSGYRANPDGTLAFIPGGPADPATGRNNAVPSEGERKAGTLLKRLEFSQKQLNDAVTESPGSAKPSVVSEMVRGTPFVGGDTPANLVTGEKRQQVEAAQLDLLDAALTLGTGAAYTKEQLRGYAKSYFPQIGDGDKTVADKKARLENVISAARIAAGRAAELGEQAANVPRGTNPNPTPKTSLDDLVKKYAD